MAVIAIASTLLVIGIKASAQFNAVMVAIKLTIVVLVIAFGLPLIKSVNLTPFVPPNTGTWGEFGWSGVFRATGVIFFAYIGFDAVSVAAQEARNPRRDIPIGILGSLIICTILYILMSLTMTGLAPYMSLNVPHPVYVAVDNAGPQLAWLRVVVNLGAVIGLASVVLVLLLGQSRVFYAMSRDGLIPPLYSDIHPKFRTPWIGTIVTGIIAALLAGHFPARHSGRACLHRDAARLCHRLPRHPGVEGEGTRPPAPLPHALGLDRGPARHGHVPVHDGVPADGHLAAPRGVDHRRPHHLRRLWHAARQGAGLGVDQAAGGIMA